MTDKMIAQLAEMRLYFTTCAMNAAPGSEAHERFTGYFAALDRVIAMLADKEARWIKLSDADVFGIYKCSACDQHVMTDNIEAYRFCHGCGRKVEWE